MKIFKRFLATLVFLIMLPAVVIGMAAFIVSTEIQPENLAEMTTDIIYETLDKDNLKKIEVEEFREYLPYDLKEKLPEGATIEEAVPVIFNSVSGLDNYISLETVNKIIEDNVIQDVTMAIINNEERDFLAMFDKYGIPLEDWQREGVAEMSVASIRKGLSDQGYDVDEIINGEIVTKITSQNETNEYMKYLNPRLTGVVLAGALVGFYLLMSLVLWDLKKGLVWWGAGVLTAGIVFLVLSVMKFEIVDFVMGLTRTSINTAILAPAIERVARPIVLAGVLGMSVGVAAILGGVILKQRSLDD